MPETTMTSREANQDFSRAKHAATRGRVVITERGKPARVLMSYDEYRRLQGAERSILEALAMRGADDIDLDLPIRRVESFRDIDLE